MGTAGKQNHFDAVAVHGTGRVTFSNEYRVASVIGYKEILAAYPAL
jgi:hypothetical protein